MFAFVIIGIIGLIAYSVFGTSKPEPTVLSPVTYKPEPANNPAITVSDKPVVVDSRTEPINAPGQVYNYNVNYNPFTDNSPESNPIAQRPVDLQ